MFWGDGEVLQGKELLSDDLRCCLNSSLQRLFIAAVTPHNAWCTVALGGTAAVVVRGLHSCTFSGSTVAKRCCFHKCGQISTDGRSARSSALTFDTY